MVSAAGLALSLLLSLLAGVFSRRAVPSFYASDVYGMTPAVHGRYALVSLGFAVLFGFALIERAVPALAIMTAFVLFMVFYLSSFARGFGE